MKTLTTVWCIAVASCIATTPSLQPRERVAPVGPIDPPEKPTVLAIRSGETIIKFLQRFCSDSTFQKQHTQFPLAIEILESSTEPGQDSVRMESVSEKASEMIDLTDEESYGGELFYDITVRVQDTGICLTYRFERWKNSWRLTRIWNQST